MCINMNRAFKSFCACLFLLPCLLAGGCLHYFGYSSYRNLGLSETTGQQAGLEQETPPEPECPEGYWVYSGELFEQDSLLGEENWQPYLLVRRCEEVYGYDLLDPASQQAFDLCYGEYFSQNIRETPQGQAFSHFTVPVPLTKSQWQNVRALYEAATISYSYRPFRYACGDDVMGKVNCLGENCPCKDPNLQYHFYAGRISFADQSQNFVYDQMEPLAEQILAPLSQDASEAEKCAFIVQYLMENTTYFTDYYWEKKIVGQLTVLNSDVPFITAYGALAKGEANCFGYARAFDYLAKKAGLRCLTVVACNENDVIGHAWNMVEVEGQWYQLDATWMDTEQAEPDWRWFLFPAGEPEHDYYNIQSYARYTFPLPQCASEPYPLENLTETLSIKGEDR